MLLAIDDVLTESEVKAWREQLGAAAWEDGASTAGAVARTQKRNQQLPENTEPALSLGHQLLRKLGNHPLFISAALPSKIYPPRFNRYSVGETYGAHVDSAVMRIPGTQVTLRTDLSATLFLSDPNEYTGGELEIEGIFGVQSVKLAAGSMVLYPSSSLHRVAPVTRGTRLASFFWIESLVANDTDRVTLFDLDQSIQALTAKLGANDPHVLKLSNVYHNLLRSRCTT